jgi:hypothetical protein
MHVKAILPADRLPLHREAVAPSTAGLSLPAEGSVDLRRIGLNVALAVAVLAAPGLPSAGAAPQRLDCVLTDTDAQSAVQHRAVTVLFDEDDKSLTVSEGGRARVLGDVTISNTSMAGNRDDISLGVDRSSWRLVFQTYSGDAVVNEYGQCKLVGGPPAR